MDAMAPASMRAPLEAALPSAMRARSIVIVSCKVRNEGDVALITGGAHPVFLCYRWYDERGELTEVGESIHEPDRALDERAPVAEGS